MTWWPSNSGWYRAARPSDLTEALKKQAEECNTLYWKGVVDRLKRQSQKEMG